MLWKFKAPIRHIHHLASSIRESRFNVQSSSRKPVVRPKTLCLVCYMPDEGMWWRQVSSNETMAGNMRKDFMPCFFSQRNYLDTLKVLGIFIWGLWTALNVRAMKNWVEMVFIFTEGILTISECLRIFAEATSW